MTPEDEREQCVRVALAITRIEFHHGLAELADVIQQTRAEARESRKAPDQRDQELVNHQEVEALKIQVAALEGNNAELKATVRRLDDMLSAQLWIED